MVSEISVPVGMFVATGRSASVAFEWIKLENMYMYTYTWVLQKLVENQIKIWFYFGERKFEIHA